MIRLHLIPYSTNVERVALALAHKGLTAEAVEHDPGDRSAIRALSGQDLVPVLEHEGSVIVDSTAIFEYLEAIQPEPSLYPAAPARATEVRVFIDWFNRVWKRSPNLIADELASDRPDRERIERHAAKMANALGWFEALLDGRDFLFGGDPGAADYAVFPFVKYAASIDPGDDEVFHRVLNDHQPLTDAHRRLAAWIARVDALPRSPAI